MANTITWNNQTIEHFVMSEDVTHDNRLFEQGVRYTVDSVVRTNEIVTTWLDSGQCTPYFDYPERVRPGHNRFPNRVYVDVVVSNTGQSINRIQFDALLAEAIGNPLWNEDGNLCRFTFRKDFDENGDVVLPSVINTHSSAVARIINHHSEAIEDQRNPDRKYIHNKLPSGITVTFRGGGQALASELKRSMARNQR